MSKKVISKIKNDKIKTIERTYGKDFSGKSTMKNIGKYLKKVGYPSLGKLLTNAS